MNGTTQSQTTSKGKGNRNLIEILQYHLKTKRFIGGLCKLEKDGSITKINGQIFDIRTTKSGLNLVLIDNLCGKKRAGQKKRWQAILAKNLIQVNEHGWQHKKVE
jgi:hypothetical protein